MPLIQCGILHKIASGFKVSSGGPGGQTSRESFLIKGPLSALMVKWWRYVPSRLAHALAGSWARWLSQRIEYFDASWQPRELYGLTFRNPLGLAAGLDKNAAFLKFSNPWDLDLWK